MIRKLKHVGKAAIKVYSMIRTAQRTLVLNLTTSHLQKIKIKHIKKYIYSSSTRCGCTVSLVFLRIAERCRSSGQEVPAS
jgi:hypothetical protein